jgi:hypothetical protein
MGPVFARVRGTIHQERTVLSSTEFGYGGYAFSWGDHICAIFDSHVQQMEVMAPFVAAGLRAEQRCAWIAPGDSTEALRQALGDMGGDLPTLEASGQLLLLSEVDFYLREGVFDPDRTLDLLQALLENNQREGYPTMRLATDVSWLCCGRIEAQAWENFESRLTEQVSERPMVMVCQYDRRQVTGDMIVAALRTHPAVILGDTFRSNPFYQPAATGAPGVGEIL